jgi:hypothetical protein
MFRAKPISKAETNTWKRPVINADFTPFQISEASRYHQPSARLICASIVVSAEADVAAAPCLIGCHTLSAHRWRRWHKFVFHIQGKTPATVWPRSRLFWCKPSVCRSKAGSYALAPGRQCERPNPTMFGNRCNGISQLARDRFLLRR